MTRNRQALGAAARERAMTEFTVAAMRYQSLYREALAAHVWYKHPLIRTQSRSGRTGGRSGDNAIYHSWRVVLLARVLADSHLPRNVAFLRRSSPRSRHSSARCGTY